MVNKKLRNVSILRYNVFYYHTKKYYNNSKDYVTIIYLLLPKCFMISLIN